jgi:hypothetical protein
VLLIQITKRSDGGGLLRCVRADGSVTWQKQESRHAGFFALHDLTHFAVESTLGFQRGFFGLIAEGWEIEETTGKQARAARYPTKRRKWSISLDRWIASVRATRFGRQRTSTSKQRSMRRQRGCLRQRR